MGVQIITDSTSDLSGEMQKKLGVEVIPLHIFFGGEEYTDGVTLQTKEFYEKLSRSEELPRTVQITPPEFETVFRRVLAQGDQAVVILISSVLSGTYQSACIARDMLGSKDIFVVDSGNVTMGLTVLVEYAVRLRERGLSAGEIFEELERSKDRVRVFAVIDTLKYLQKGGRLSKSTAMIGTLLQVKPVICVYQGDITVIQKVRGTKNAQRWMADMLKEKGIDFSYPFCLGSTNAPEQAEGLRKIMWNQLADKNCECLEIGGTVGVHAGPNCAGLGCFLAEPQDK